MSNTTNNTNNSKMISLEPLMREDGTVYAAKVNGGGILVKGENEKVNAAISAWQDINLGVYDCERTEEGLHFRATASLKGIENGVGYVSSNYTGNKIEAPSAPGWHPVDSFDGFLSIGEYEYGDKGRKHKALANYKHAYVDVLCSGKGYYIEFKPWQTARLEDAIAKVNADDGKFQRKLSIRSSIHHDEMWKKSDHVDIPNPEKGEGLIFPIHGKEEEINLYEVENGTMLQIWSRRGEEMKPCFWLPEVANNVKWWAGFASDGGTVALPQ